MTNSGEPALALFCQWFMFHFCAQDPNVIMVGEIMRRSRRDGVNAALTGHLLLSTLHTNDAATTFAPIAGYEN